MGFVVVGRGEVGFVFVFVFVFIFVFVFAFELPCVGFVVGWLRPSGFLFPTTGNSPWELALPILLSAEKNAKYLETIG